MIVPFAVVSAALLVACRGFWGHLLARPGSIDGASVSLWITAGVLPLLAALACWSAALGLGRRTGHKAGDAVSAALGLGLLAQAVFVLAWAGALNRPALAALAVATALLAYPLRARSLPALPRPSGLWQGLAAGLLGFAALAVSVTALAPSLEWDVRAYHLALPELYLRAGGLRDLPWMIHSHWPRLLETFYSLPLAFGSDSAAALIHAGAAILLVGATAASAGSAAAGWAAALALAGQPALLRVAGAAHCDAAAALFVFAAALALAKWEEKRDDRTLVIAGLLAGLAASAKLLGVAACGAWTLALLWKTRRLRPAALFAVAAGLMLGPWLWTTWRATGDPVWPFLKTGAESASLAVRYLRSNRWNFPPPASLLAHDGPGFLLIPALVLAALSRGRRAAASGVERWLWLAAPAYAFLGRRHNEAWRFLMPVWPAFALALGRSASAALAGGKARRALAATAVLAAGLPILALSPNNALFAVAGVRSDAAPAADRRELFLERSLDTASFFKEARAVLPPGAKVLLFREVRGYQAGFDYVWGDPMNQNAVDYRRLAGPDELGARLKELGVTHVLDHSGSHLYQEDPAYYDARTLGLMAARLARGARPVLVREGITLYEL